MSSRIGWLDCTAGAAGDMVLAALLDAGVPGSVVEGAVASLGLAVQVEIAEVSVGSLAARRVTVTASEPDPPRRTLRDVVGVLDTASLEPAVRALALDVFGRLARAEATVHGTTPDDVHFHEVGALDALADVVGCSAAFVHLGLSEVVVSPIALGSGRAGTEHGRLPVPVPAVLELLRESGLPATAGDAPFEQCTPTGAAILSAVATSSGGLPPMSIESVGVGAGTRRSETGANVVRLVIGEALVAPSGAAPGPPSAVLLSTNVDDLDPRLWPSVLEALLAAGASDAWLTPILMKKGRPAHTLSVLCCAEDADALQATVFQQTTALGLRRTTVHKVALERSEHVVAVSGGRVRVKLGHLDGAVVNRQPEYEDVRAAAEAAGLPLKVVLAEAVAAAAETAVVEHQPTHAPD